MLPAMTARIHLLSLLVFAASLLLFADARAFDGHRQGFVLGFSAGLGHLDFGQERESTWGVQTDLKLGAGLTDQTLLHYTGKQIWHSDDNITYTEAMPMLGVTHYLKPQGPSVFLSGAGGAAILAAFTGGDAGGVVGPAGFVGGGYEFARHFQVEAGVAVMLNEPFTLYNFSVTVGVLGY
jgi:hypothetical protein